MGHWYDLSVQILQGTTCELWFIDKLVGCMHTSNGCKYSACQLAFMSLACIFFCETAFRFCWAFATTWKLRHKTISIRWWAFCAIWSIYLGLRKVQITLIDKDYNSGEEILFHRVELMEPFLVWCNWRMLLVYLIILSSYTILG